MLSRNNYGLDLFNELFKDPFFHTSYADVKDKPMRTDIYETNSVYLLEIELPGFSREDIQVELTKGYLTITAAPAKKPDDVEKRQIVHQERYHGSYKRSFYVGDKLRQEDIKAAFADGILKLTVPKEVPKKLDETRRFISIE